MKTGTLTQLPAPARFAEPRVASRAVLILAVLLGMLLVVAPRRALAAEGILWQHTAGDIVYGVATSADGGVIAVGSRDSFLYVFDREGSPLWEFEANGTIYGVAVSADGSRVGAASEDRTAYVFDGTGQLLWKHSAQRTITSIDIAPDGSLVAIGSEDRTVRVFDGSGNPLWDQNLGIAVNSVAVGAEGQLVLVGTRDSRVVAYNRDGQLLWEYQVADYVRGVAANRDGSLVVAGSEDSNVYVFDGQGQLLWTFATGDKVNSVNVTADGSLITAGSWDRNVYLLDQSGNVVQRYQTGDAVYATALSADGATLVVGSADRNAYVFDVEQAIGGFAAAQTRGSYLAIGLIVGTVLVFVALYLFLGHTRVGRDVWGTHSAGPRGLLREIWRSRISYLFLAPTFVMVLSFDYYPALSGLYHAFTDWNPGGETRWVGLANFTKMINDFHIAIGVRNLAILIVTDIVKQLTVPLIVAELIFNLSSRRLQYWARTLFVVPTVVPSVVLILLWREILDPNRGMANQFLALLGRPDLQRVWLGDPSWALATIIFVGFPWISALALLVYYGGLISIPSEIFDAALVDGVSVLRRIWQIDLPLLLAQIKLILILTFISGMQGFILILLLTGGGPSSVTTVPGLEIYYQAVRYNDFGYASAIATALFVVILAGTIVNLRYVRSSTEYQV